MIGATSADSDAIAIIGMAGRFPGAGNVEQLWDLLKNGGEALTQLTDEELRRAGVDDTLLSDPNYVKACMKLDGVELFDAAFFGYTRQQATLLDPQHRLFLECAWEALEAAGYNPADAPGSVGVFAGCGTRTYSLWGALQSGQNNLADQFQQLIDTEKDFLATRASYKFGLTGPSITVQTACSTSLVAVHLACQSLLSFECDAALAGGVSVQIPQDRGYLYIKDGIVSADGHCRAFDASATGMIFGSGVALVVLKRLADALRDADTIHAIIKGTAINNDGKRKVGYTAPALHGQAEVIASALAVAGVEPRTVGLIEAHGTGTTLGDSIELSALNEVFRTGASGSRYCALGSVKTNIGHLDTAAGVVGLIKAILCLKHRAFVPSLHLKRPNAVLESVDSPFFVSTAYSNWSSGPERRRAGVSSFGIGGTNAHVVLEEAPTRAAVASEAQEDLLFPLSAHSAAAVAQLERKVIAHLRAHRDISAADAAYTLQVGRKRFGYRKYLIARDVEQLAAISGNAEHAAAATVHDDCDDRPVIFMFPGQGSGRGVAIAELYKSESLFAGLMDRCLDLISHEIGRNARRPTLDSGVTLGDLAGDPLLMQPLLLAIEYCLARLWMSWGVQPTALVGHSLGEFAAACIAEVLSIEDAIRLVCERARLVSGLPRGAMVAVGLPEQQIRSRLGTELSFAAINSPRQCVVSGPEAPIDALCAKLSEDSIQYRQLPGTSAFHSPMMDLAAQELAKVAAGLQRRAPAKPYVSCVYGRRATDAELTDAGYWAAHLCSTVLFSQSITHLKGESHSLFLEVGPGSSLAGLVRHHIGPGDASRVVASLPEHRANDRASLLHVLGELWQRGVMIDWSRLHASSRRFRVELPTYPFERQRYWIERANASVVSARDSSAGNGEHLRDKQMEKDSTDAATAKELQAGAERVLPRTELERAVAGIWEDALGVPAVAVNDRFLNIGGDSLIALRVGSRIRERFRVEISLEALISPTATVASLAREIVFKLAEQRNPDLVQAQINAVKAST